MSSVCSLVLNSVSSDARVLKQAQSAANDGHSVTIVCIREKPDDCYRETINGGVKIIRCDYLPQTMQDKKLRRLPAPLRKLSGMLAMLLAICQVKPYILHCHDVYTLPLGAVAKTLLRCRLIYDAHEIYEHAAGNNDNHARKFRLVHRAFAGFCDGFVTINSSLAAWYGHHYPALPKAVVVMNATTQQEPIAYDGRLHRAAGLPPEVKILLVQGGLTPHRGLEKVAESSAHLPPEWAVVMMGNGCLRESLSQTAEKLRVNSNLPHAPLVLIPAAPLKELPQWTAGASIGLIPYENTGLNHWFCTPNKLWEYPGAGVPVLASPFPEMKKMITSYGFGWLLDDDWKAAELADQVTKISSNEIVERQNCCKRFVDSENWNKYALRLLALYRQLGA